MSWVVDGPDELTPAQLTGALRANGLDVEVCAFDAERIGTGQMGATYRLTLFSEGAAGPPTLVLKVGGDDEAMRRIVAPGYAAEVGFYQHLAPHLDVRTPRCWHAAIDDDHRRFALLLDDAAPAEPGVQVDGCSLDQASVAVQNLVGLHAPRWGDSTLAQHRFLMRPSESMAATMQAALSGAVGPFVERYGDDLAAEDVDTLRAVAGCLARWQLTRLEPTTLVHGDYRLDNLLFAPGGAVSAVDWQSAAVGPALRDVAYFLGTSLHTEVRREHERELVGEYHSALVERGIAGYDADRCWEDYRLGQLQGPTIAVIGCIYASSERTAGSDGMFLAMVRRSCAAIRDLASLELV